MTDETDFDTPEEWEAWVQKQEAARRRREAEVAGVVGSRGQLLERCLQGETQRTFSHGGEHFHTLGTQLREAFACIDALERRLRALED